MNIYVVLNKPKTRLKNNFQVDSSVLFESDGMCSGDASQKTPRQVLLRFLDIARIFGKRKDYTGPLPDLVKFEHVSFELEIFFNFHPFLGNRCLFNRVSINSDT